MDLYDMATRVRQASHFNAAWYHAGSTRPQDPPDQYYSSPADLLRDRRLSSAEKSAQLQQWRRQLLRACDPLGRDGPDGLVEQTLVAVDRALTALSDGRRLPEQPTGILG